MVEKTCGRQASAAFFCAFPVSPVQIAIYLSILHIFCPRRPFSWPRPKPFLDPARFNPRRQRQRGLRID